jgi:hypothetical protein
MNIIPFTVRELALLMLVLVLSVLLVLAIRRIEKIRRELLQQKHNNQKLPTEQELDRN